VKTVERQPGLMFELAAFVDSRGKNFRASPLEMARAESPKTGEFFKTQNTRRVKSMIRRDSQPTTGQLFCFGGKMTN
jgi:hypothetical protein